MSACGIEVRGRSKKLYLNYRTTEEIRLTAVALLEGCEVDDLDDGIDEVRRYKSISKGPQPSQVSFASLSDAIEAAIKTVQQAVTQKRSSCIMVARKAHAEQAGKELSKADIPHVIIGPNQRDKADSFAVRIATMHRAKGLEFDEVVLLVPGKMEKTPDFNQLKYVALTRARRLASVFSFSA
jgi:DNA helicase IV